MGEFDPYQAWLNIPSTERPVNHYRLLGLRPLEDNGGAISSAADRVAAHLAQFGSGQYATECRRLLAEIDLARATLLDPARKQAYDASLGGTPQSAERAIQAAPAVPGSQPAGQDAPLIRPAPPVPGTTPRPIQQGQQAAQPATPAPGPATPPTHPDGPVIQRAPPVPGGALQLPSGAGPLPTGPAAQMPAGTIPTGGVPTAPMPGTPPMQAPMAVPHVGGVAPQTPVAPGSAIPGASPTGPMLPGSSAPTAFPTAGTPGYAAPVAPASSLAPQYPAASPMHPGGVLSSPPPPVAPPATPPATPPPMGKTVDPDASNEKRGSSNWIPAKRSGHVGKSVSALVDGKTAAVPQKEKVSSVRTVPRRSRNRSSYQVIAFLLAAGVLLLLFIAMVLILAAK